MFSRSAKAEAERKSFGVSRTVAIRIHEALQRQIEKTLRASELPVIKSTEATQRGETFGDRLANAIQDCWAKGFETLIVVGGDSPELSTCDIKRAHTALQSGQTALGNDFRGGSFLIGLQKASFRQNQFAELPWQTDQIGCALRRELGLTCEGSITEVLALGSRADCNSKQDLKDFAKRATDTVWSALLHATTCRIVDFDNALELVSCFGESLTSRGPPTELPHAA